MKTRTQEVPLTSTAYPSDYTKPIAFNLAIRTHNDTESDTVSKATALDTGNETPVRQEFGHDADVNNLLNKYNVDPRGRPIEFQEVDYSTDLQQALHAVDVARTVVNHVPEELRSAFPTWQHVLNGAENGTYAAALKDLDDRKEAAKNKAAQAAREARPEKETPPPEPKG